jgi:hypothetical protein
VARYNFSFASSKTLSTLSHTGEASLV